MKFNFKTIAAAAAMVSLLAACSKEDFKEQNSDNGIISVEVSGNLGDLTPAADSKASVSPVVRLNWDNGDVVYAYDATTCLGSLTAKVDDSNKNVAKLSGTITAPASGTAITLVYTNISSSEPVVSEGKLSFDMSSQTTDKIPFVVYGTMNYSGNSVISNLVVPFSFATSVIRVGATGLSEDNSTAIDKVTLSGVSTQCELTLSGTAAPAVSGTAAGNIVLNKGTQSFASQDGKAIVTFGVAATGASAHKNIAFLQGNVEMYSEFYNGNAIKISKSITTVVSTTRIDFVVINGLKWAKQNLAITASGKMKWKGRKENAAVKVPGTDEDVIVGDYFQWAAHENYAMPVQDLGNGKTDKGLLIYKSFNHKDCVDGGGSNNFEFKSPDGVKKYLFLTDGNDEWKAIVPHFDTENWMFTKYNDSDNRNTLEREDDVANIILGGNWRMPTDDEFKTLCDATYWAWDGTDEGYYVFIPGQGTSGSAGWKWNIDESDDKTEAVLFFPAAGWGYYECLEASYGIGRYSSSSLCVDDWHTSYYPRNIHYLVFGFENVDPYCNDTRWYGYTVRPVSD